MTTVVSSRPARLLALKVLREQWADFMAREPGTLRGDDPEQLHRMRVAHRRLRSALQAFEAVLPPELVSAGPELRWIGRELGHVRDLDVQIADIAGRDLEHGHPEGRKDLLEALEAQRDAARERMLEALTGSRFEALVLQVARSLREQVAVLPSGQEPSVGQLAPRVLTERYRRFRKAARKVGPKARPEVLHAARRHARRLRFTAEFFEETYGEPIHDLIEALEDLQDQFGEHQDCYAAIETRRGLRKRLKGESLKRTKELDRLDRARARELREAAPSAVEAVRRSWKALRKALKAQEP